MPTHVALSGPSPTPHVFLQTDPFLSQPWPSWGSNWEVSLIDIIIAAPIDAIQHPNHWIWVRTCSVLTPAFPLLSAHHTSKTLQTSSSSPHQIAEPLAALGHRVTAFARAPFAARASHPTCPRSAAPKVHGHFPPNVVGPNCR